jgi:hypothetical protein
LEPNATANAESCAVPSSAVRAHPAALNLLSKFVDKRLRVARKHSNSGTEWPIDAVVAALQLSNKLSRWPTLNSVNLDSYRLKVKELLYLLQFAKKGDEYLVKKLAQVRVAIGEWHDWQELARIAGKALHHQSQCNLLKQIRTRVQTTFEHAVEIANKMRKQSLKGSASLMFSSPLAESSARARLKSER